MENDNKNYSLASAFTELIDAMNGFNGNINGKLTSTDGIKNNSSAYEGDYLVWYDYEDFHLTSVDDHETAFIREEYPHWEVYLIGNTYEDKDEIKRQTQLPETCLQKLYKDVDLLEIQPQESAGKTTYVYLVGSEGIRAFYKPLDLPMMQLVSTFSTNDSNDEKTNRLIADGLSKGYSLTDCILWCVKLGFFSVSEVIDFAEECRNRVESFGYEDEKFAEF